MRPRIPAVIAVPAAVLAVAACSPAATSGISPPPPAAPAAAPASVPSSPSHPAGAPANITVAPAGGFLPGPEKLTFLSCGKLTAAQQVQFSTNATTGLVYRFTNNAAFAAFPQVNVNFLNGNTVVASNVSDGSANPISPGQSEEGEVDTGPQAAFTSCEIMDYLLIAGPDVRPTQYAG
jgi:hypothetical protein